MVRKAGQDLRSNFPGACDDSADSTPRQFWMRMKTNPPPPAAVPVLNVGDIRAYAAHLYAQSGRIPNRDIENWLEAKACLEANVSPPAVTRRPGRSRSRRPGGFTMPASDASLWIERVEGG